MKLWLLKAKSDIEFNLVRGSIPEVHSWRWNPWDQNYGCNQGIVVRAETENDAREIADMNQGRETMNPWLNPKFTTCEELTSEGEPDVILIDCDESEDMW